MLGLVLAHYTGVAQTKKFLFDATKAEMAANADWVIDTDVRNLGVNSSTHQMQTGLGNESNPQRIPTPAASGITASTAETYWGGALSSWAVALVKLGYGVETLPYNGRITYGDGTNTQDLSNYNVFVVCEPNILFTAAEKTAILTFVQNGGGLFMVSDHNASDRNSDGQDSPHIWNDLMQTNTVQANPFGITFNYDNVSPTTSEMNTASTDSVIHGPAGTVSQLIYNNGATITINTANNASVTASIWTTTPHSNSNIMCAFARFGGGKVVGIGDSSPPDDGTGDPNDGIFPGWTDAGGNHGKLFTNASAWLAGPVQQTFPLTASAGSNGSISPNGVVNVTSGANQTFTISPNTGYHVVDVLVDGGSVGAVSNYTFTNVSSSHTINAAFVVNVYTIVPSAGANGTIAPSGSVNVNYNASQGFTLTPGTGYHVQNVLVDGVSVGAVGSYTFNNVAANHTISATFVMNVYTIAASAGANGTITPGGSVNVNYNGSQGFTVTPGTGYHVTDVLVDGGSVGAVSSYTFTTVTSNHTISASFAVNVYTIAASTGAHGAIAPSGSVNVNYNASQGFTLTPVTGYHVQDVLVDAVSVGAVGSYTFTNVAANHTISATFVVNQYTISASSAPNGSLSPSGPVITDFGTNQTFTIAPSINYHIDSLLVDNVNVDSVASYTFFSVNANHTIRAVFAIDQFAITTTSGSHGSIVPGGTVAVGYGGNQSFSIAPAVGYHLDSVLVDVGRVDSTTSYTFTNVTTNHSISASFSVNQYTITASADSHGTISPSGAITVNYGTNQMFTVSPDSGYARDTLLVDGLAATSSTTYQFSNIAGSHTIRVTFKVSTAVVEQINVTDQWNIVSVPLTVDDGRTIVIFPTAVSSAYAFDPASGYFSHDTLMNGIGYWLKFSAPQTLSITGNIRTEDTIHVHAGWNMIGSISTSIPTSSITQIPSGIVISNYFSYGGSYVQSDTIQFGNGYWVKVNQNGRLILH